MSAGAKEVNAWGRFLESLPEDCSDREQLDFVLELLIQLTCRTDTEGRYALHDDDLVRRAEQLRRDWYGEVTS